MSPDVAERSLWRPAATRIDVRFKETLARLALAALISAGLTVLAMGLVTSTCHAAQAHAAVTSKSVFQAPSNRL